MYFIVKTKISSSVCDPCSLTLRRWTEFKFYLLVWVQNYKEPSSELASWIRGRPDIRFLISKCSKVQIRYCLASDHLKSNCINDLLCLQNPIYYFIILGKYQLVWKVHCICSKKKKKKRGELYLIIWEFSQFNLNNLNPGFLICKLRVITPSLSPSWLSFRDIWFMKGKKMMQVWHHYHYWIILLYFF